MDKYHFYYVKINETQYLIQFKYNNTSHTFQNI